MSSQRFHEGAFFRSVNSSPQSNRLWWQTMLAINHSLQFAQIPTASQPVDRQKSTAVTSHPRRLTQTELAEVLLETGLVERSQQLAADEYLRTTERPLSFLDVLVMQGALSPETIDFFIHQFPSLKASPNSANLGLVLRAANLLTTRQQSEILRYQRMHPRMRFGEIAIELGYCKPRVIDFFLKTLYSSGRTASRVPHSSIGNRTKRLFDVAGALAGLAVAGVLFVPLAIAIRLDSPGPVLYSQVRLGLRGKPFRLWKFRSMVRDAAIKQRLLKSETKGQFFKQKNDPRITRVGKFLRKTSLDEFPQFWNVLVGDMSLVGTRPPTPQEAMEYKDWHWQRLNVKTGITGEWQVNGRSSITDFDEVVKLDMRYQTCWSMKHDFDLIRQTIKVIISRQHAC